VDSRQITLTYTIADGEDQHLDFTQQVDCGDWTCTLSAEEMDRIIKSAIDKGTLE
jgi:hypothetical protein